jgi:hypothetical protein
VGWTNKGLSKHGSSFFQNSEHSHTNLNSLCSSHGIAGGRVSLEILLLFPFFLIKLHLPLDIPTKYHMLKQQLILCQYPFFQLRKLLLVHFFQRIDLIHKLQLLQVKRLLIIFFRQVNKLLVLIKLVMVDMLVDKLVKVIDVRSC